MSIYKVTVRGRFQPGIEQFPRKQADVQELCHDNVIVKKEKGGFPVSDEF